MDEKQIAEELFKRAKKGREKARECAGFGNYSEALHCRSFSMGLEQAALWIESGHLKNKESETDGLHATNKLR